MANNQPIGTVCPVPMGEWQANVPYEKLNIVRYNGASYMAKKPNQDFEPTVKQGWQEVWQIIVYDGKGVSSTSIAYQAGLSNAVIPTGEWTTDIPNVPQGQYLWTRIIYYFTDGSEATSYSVSLQGLNFTQADRDNIDNIVGTLPRIQSDIDTLQGDVDRIDGYIPSTTSATNQLADKAFVNSSINNSAAFYITFNAQGNAFSTRASLLNATKFYSGGKTRVPTQNDYATVLADESQPKGVDGTYPTTRYSYQTDTQNGTYPNGQWDFQYVVNNTSLTQAQVDAINSGITAILVAKLNGIDLSKYLLLSGGTMTGDLTIGSGYQIKWENIGPVNTAPTYYATFVNNLAANGLTYTRAADMPFAKISHITTGSLNAVKDTGLYGVTSAVTERPAANDGYLYAIRWKKGQDYCAQIFQEGDSGNLYIRTNNTSAGNNWGSWQRMLKASEVSATKDADGIWHINLGV